MSTAARVKVAVIGAGGWGLQHARIFAARPDTQLVAIVGRTEERNGDAANCGMLGARAANSAD